MHVGRKQLCILYTKLSLNYVCIHIGHAPERTCIQLLITHMPIANYRTHDSVP